MSSITPTEGARLIALEATIERGLETFVEVGEALREIRDARLYAASHQTFEAYCRERWGISRSYAHRTIEAAGVATRLPIGNRPTNEAQARELVRLGDETARVNAWREATAGAIAEDRRVTASDVRAAVEARRPKPSSSAEPPTESANGDSPTGRQAKPEAPSSPAACVTTFVAGCERLIRAAQCVEIEQAVREERAGVEMWLTNLSATRDAVDRLIERAQRAADEDLAEPAMAAAKAEADQLGIELKAGR